MPLDFDSPPLRDALAELRRLLDARTLNVLVGAGLSLPAKTPTWRGLLERLAKEAALTDEDLKASLDRKIADGHYLRAAASARTEMGQERFHSVMDKIFRREVQVDAPGLTHPALVSLPFRVLLTTNYDRLIFLHDNRVNPRRPLTEVTWQEAHALPGWLADPDMRLLVHLHGLVTRPQTYVLTEDDYRLRLHDGPYREVLRQIMGQPLLVLGFGLEDQDIMSSIEDLASLFTLGPPRYALVPRGTDVARLRRRFHVEALVYEPSDGHPEVEEFLRALAPARVVPLAAEAAPRAPYLVPDITEPFAGREAELNALVRRLAGADSPVVEVIAGSSGLGKTTLARQAAVELRTAFADGVLWHRWDARGIEGTLDVFERALELPPEARPDARAGRLRDLLATRRLLVVLDDVADFESVAALIPEQGRARVLLTTRNLELAERFGRPVLGLPSVDDAVALLAAYAGRGLVEQTPAAARALAMLLRSVPLALAVAGRTARAAGALDAVQVAGDADNPVRAALDAAWRPLDALARTALVVFALPGARSVALAALAAALDVDLEVAGRAAADLRRAGFALEAGGRFTVHPLVTTYAGEHLGAHPEAGVLRERWSRHHVALAREVKRLWNAGQRAEAQALLEPELTTLEAVHAAGDAEMQTALIDALGLILLARRDLALCESWHQSQIARAAEAGDEVRLTASYNEISQIHKARGQLDEAETWLRKAIDIAERLDDQPKLAIAYNNLSQIHQDRGQLDDAEVWLRKAIDIDEHLGDQPNLAILYNNLSQVYDARGQLDEAETWLRKAIDIAERLGDQPNLAIRYNNLSQIHKARGQLHEAEAWLQKAIDIDERLGDQPSLAIDYNNLSLIHQARGQIDEAEAWLRKAIGIAERLGDQPKLAIACNNLSQIHQARGQLDEAEAWLRKAIDIAERLDDRVKLRTLYGNMAILLREAKREAEAEAFDAKRHALDEDHP